MRIRAWLNDHKFETHLAIFITIVVSSIGLFFAAQSNIIPIIWLLLGAILLANLLAIFTG